MREAKTQQEFEELSKLGEWFYVTSGNWVAWGQSHVEAREQSHVVATSPHVSILAKSRDALLRSGYILVYAHNRLSTYKFVVTFLSFLHQPLIY